MGFFFEKFLVTAALHKHLDRTGADPQVVQGIVQLAKEFIADNKEWQNFSISPEFYLSSGLYDIYGNIALFGRLL